MVRDDDSTISLRDLTRWLFPAFIVLLGLALFFGLIRKTQPRDTPVPVELPSL